MNTAKKFFFKKCVAIVSLALFTSQTAAPLAGGLSEASAATPLLPNSVSGIDTRARLKLNVAMDETDSETGVARKSNVLFMIDTSQSTMIFTSWGVQPWIVDRSDYTNATDRADWRKTWDTFGYTFKDVVDMMADCTYGIGSLPSVQSTGRDGTSGVDRTEKNILFGRDVDDRNNYKSKAPGDLNADIEKYKNDYYFPFTSTNNPLDAAFQSQRTEYVTDVTARTKAQGDAGVARTSNAYVDLSANTAFPYALVFRNPAYWQNGWSGPGEPTQIDLVPNDSRMYKTKLVLWRLLEDTKLFENIRFGMASIFADMNQTAFSNLNHFKHAPFTSGAQGAAAVARSVTTDNPDNQTAENYNGYYINGVLQRDATGQPGSGHDSRDTVTASSWRTGSTSAITRPSVAEHIEMNRAHLKLPIADYAKIWKTGSGSNERSLTHADKFRLWINGLNDVARGDFYEHKDPELIPSGNFQLASAIFQNPRTGMPGMPNGYNMQRSTYISRGLLWYAEKSNVTKQGNSGYQSTTHRYKGESGEAAGAILDFFSPPVNDLNNSVKNNMDDVSFPIRDVCEDNWVVLLTSGIEVKTNDDTYVYKVRDAIRDLYDHTAGNKVTRMYYDGNTRRFDTDAELNNPIRTIVVGMVGEDQSEQIEELRDNLWQMAWAGQGVPEGLSDAQKRADYPQVKPLFASNVDELLEALRAALVYINDNQQQPEKGSMTESPALINDDNPSENEGEDLNLFASTYRVRNFNQWEATLKRYSTTKDENGIITAKEQWEFSRKLRNQRSNRKIYYWNGGAFTQMSEGNADFNTLTGASAINATTTGASLPPGNDAAKWLFQWLQGYDYSYENGRLYERQSMLSDFGQSGVAFVDKPARMDSLPGYKEWADGKQGVKPMLYAQTNDGILHLIDPKHGTEEKAILPPPVLIPSRLVTLKSSVGTSNSVEWMDVNDEEMELNDKSGDHRSKAAYLLDGALQARRFNFTGTSASGWNTYLLGALGRAGSGLYMMDIDNYSNPKFMWYWEKLGDKLLYMQPADNTPFVYSDTDTLPGEKNRAYEKLGFNSPKPAMGVASNSTAKGFDNFIALAGGARSKNTIDATNRQEGAALLIIDPETGYVSTAFDNASIYQDVQPKWRVETQIGGLTGTDYMGMMVSEPTLYRSDQTQYLTGQIFAADGRGNIFRILCERKDNDGNITTYSTPSGWEIETVATLQNGTGGNSGNYAIPHGVVLGIANSSLWAAGGTADIRTVKSVESDNDTGIIKNTEQMIFAFNTAAKDGTLYRRDDSANNWEAVKSNDTTYLDSGKNGWYIELDSGGNYHSEYVSAKPLVVDGTLYIATFKQQKVNTIGNFDKCVSRHIRGVSRLYAVDITNARGNTWAGGDKMVEFEGVKLTGLTHSKQGKRESIIVTFDNLSNEQNNLEQVAGQHENMEYVSGSEGFPSLNIPLNPHSVVGLTDGQSAINYWLQK